MLCTRQSALALLVVIATVLSGCTLHRVSSSRIKSIDSPVEQVVIVIKKGTFNGVSTASTLGNRNLHNLIPHLQSRLPLAFGRAGIEARAVVSEEGDKQLPPPGAPGEATLLIMPVSALYSSRSGQQLKLRALLLEAKSSLPAWKAEITLNTPGFGKFDAELADKIAEDLLQKLRDDEVIRMHETVAPAS